MKDGEKLMTCRKIELPLSRAGERAPPVRTYIRVKPRLTTVLNISPTHCTNGPCIHLLD